MSVERKPLALSIKELDFLHRCVKFANNWNPRTAPCVGMPRDHPFEDPTFDQHEVQELCLRLHSYIARCKTERAQALEEQSSNANST